MKKLIPALCMLLVAATLLGTSTYAWFSMNTTVAATGMEVKASTSDSLAISATGDAGSFTNSMELATIGVGGTMNPATAVATNGTANFSVANGDKTDANLTSISFYTLNTDNNMVLNPDSHAATKTMAEAITEDKVADYFDASADTNYITDDMYLLYTGEDAVEKGIYLGIEVKGTDSTIDKALHIAFLVDGKWYNFDLSEDFTNGATYTKVVNDFVTLTSGTAKKISVYAWYEGEDTDCKTTNAVATNGLTIDIKWSTEAITYA